MLRNKLVSFHPLYPFPPDRPYIPATSLSLPGHCRGIIGKACSNKALGKGLGVVIPPAGWIRFMPRPWNLQLFFFSNANQNSGTEGIRKFQVYFENTGCKCANNQCIERTKYLINKNYGVLILTNNKNFTY
jgi:hypothetical protein